MTRQATRILWLPLLVAFAGGCPGLGDPGLTFGDGAAQTPGDAVVAPDGPAAPDVPPVVGPQCTDDDACAGWVAPLGACVEAHCDATLGRCVAGPAPDCCLSAADCDDGDPCTHDACPAPGERCTHTGSCETCTRDADCSDGNLCTDDRCASGRCRFTPRWNCCTDDGDCRDSDPCTRDRCVDNVCRNEAGADCCTVDDDCPTSPCSEAHCVAGACVTTLLTNCCTAASDCPPAEACADYRCEDAQCVRVPRPNCCVADAACSDGDPCTRDRCVASRCVQEPVSGCCRSAIECPAGDACHWAACIDYRCTFVATGSCCASDAECSDGDPCTRDACVAGGCQNVVNTACCNTDDDCADGDPCTTERCIDRVCTSTPVADCCVSAADCPDDGNPCTQPRCEAGRCRQAALAGCCRSAADCPDDGDPCSYARCVQATCFHEALAGCCVADADCPDDDDPCTTARCTDGRCTVTPIDCCLNGCDDGDPCTRDVCVGGLCQHAADLTRPGCCSESTTYAEHFSAALVGFEFTSTNPPVGWTLAANRVRSQPYALRFGHPTRADFAAPNGGPVAGAATTPPIAVPFAQRVVARLHVYLDVESDALFDRFTIEAQSDDTAAGLLFDKADLAEDEFRRWTALELDLSTFVGRSVRLTFRFDSVDATANDGEGVYVDDVVVLVPCDGPVACSTPSDCADGDACTIDTCASGDCRHEPDPDCCSGATLFANDFDAGDSAPLTLAGDAGAARFHVSGRRFASPPFALHFGDPTGADLPAGPTWGMAWLPPFTLAAAGYATLAFDHLEVLGGDPWAQRFKLYLVDGPAWTELWSRPESPAPDAFRAVAVDLSGFAGRTIQLVFVYDSFGGVEPPGEGVYLDNLVVESECMP